MECLHILPLLARKTRYGKILTSGGDFFVVVNRCVFVDGNGICEVFWSKSVAL